MNLKEALKMLKEAIDFINCNIKPLGLAANLLGLCEIIEDGKLSYPVQYKNGEYNKIHDIDVTKGIVYHRIRSSYSESENPEASTTGCDRMVERTYPMRCLVIARKDNKGDSAYSDEVISNLISNNIIFRNDRELRMSLRLDTIEANVTSVNLSRKDVFSSEFKGIDQFIDYEYTMLSIDYNLIIGADINCFRDC